jgi:hypothetical protein
LTALTSVPNHVTLSSEKLFLTKFIAMLKKIILTHFSGPNAAQPFKLLFVTKLKQRLPAVFDEKILIENIQSIEVVKSKDIDRVIASKNNFVFTFDPYGLSEENSKEESTTLNIVTSTMMLFPLNSKTTYAVTQGNTSGVNYNKRFSSKENFQQVLEMPVPLKTLYWTFVEILKKENIILL